jgi:hypothetical protein
MDLGDFRFGRGIRIYDQNAASTGMDPSLVETHESYHLHMSMSTPFGVFQNFLGFIVSNDDIQNSIKPIYRKAFKATKENSWMTHEGVATTCELLVCFMQNREMAARVFAVLPPEYKKACEPLCKIVSKVPLPIVIGPEIVEAIGYIALATPILRDMEDHSIFVKTDWDYYFRDTNRNPDLRFAILLDTLSLLKTRNQIYNSVINVFNILGLPSEKMEFIDYYRNLTIEKQKECNDAVRKATINNLQLDISLTVEDEENIVPLYRSMVKPWFIELGISNVQHNFVENPKPTDVEDQLRIFLDQIDYVPSDKQKMFLEGILFINDPKYVYVDKLKNYGNPFYAKLLYNGSSENIETPDNPLIIPIGGGVLLLHSANQNAEKFHFTCPIEQRHANAAFAIKIPPEEISNLCNIFSEIDCVISIDEIAYRWSSNHIQLFLKQHDQPIVIIPTNSGLSSWTNAIKDILGNEYVLGYYGVDDEYQNYCLMSSQDGHIVLARPTSEIVYSRILKDNKRVKSYSDWNDVSKQFSPKWSVKLRIACNHYLQFGW